MDLIKHIEYQRWANRKTVEQIKHLTNDALEQEFGGSFPSIRLTILHLLQADFRWLHRLKGFPIVDLPASWQTEPTEALIATWLGVQDQLVSEVKKLPADKPIQFTTAKGDHYELPLEEVITHVVNHSTYHRGQLVNMLRMAGEKPSGTDYFLFVTSKGA
jgi:uncharacterized damage-inducible protein DinB